MKVLLSRSLVCGLLLVGLAVGSSSGCRTGTGWGWPSATSSTNWLSWNNWGWGKDSAAAKDTALAATKPPTTVPKPSASATAQPTTSIAAGTGGAAATAGATPQYTASNTPAYPTTNQPNNGYGAQTASAWQQNGAANQVQPTVGYQTGPYNTTSQGSAAPYGQASQPIQPNYGGGTSWNPETSAPNAGNAAPGATYGAAASPYGGNTAGGMYGTQEPSPYSGDQSQQGAYGGNPAGAANYGGQPNYGAGNTAPAPQANPWNNYSQPQPDYRSSTPPATSPYGSPAANYDAISSSDPAPGAPAAAPSSFPGVPASLATDAGSYRPGSTAGGVQNAGYNQPQTASGVNVNGAASYGNTYTR